MKSKLTTTFAALGAALWVNMQVTHAAPAGGKLLMGYYPNWSHYQGYTADRIPYAYLTHILYAFYLTDPAGNLANSDPQDEPNFRELIRRAHAQGVKVLVSIGGYGQSSNYAPMAASPGARANFVKNALKLCEEYGLDGMDIDWEFPEEKDSQNQLLLHREIRAALDKQPRKFLFTEAVAATEWFGHTTETESLQLLDYLNIMSYDYMGTWEKTVIPNSGMDQSKATLEYYEKRGIPRSKLVLGAAFYGKTFDGGTGMGSGYEGKGSGNDGILQWREILTQLQASPYKVYWDAKTQSEYAVGNDEIIVFNGIPSTRVRGEFIRDHDYAGVMLWDLLKDVQETDKSLLVALYRGLHGTNRGPMATPPAGP